MVLNVLVGISAPSVRRPAGSLYEKDGDSYNDFDLEALAVAALDAKKRFRKTTQEPHPSEHAE